MRPEKAGPKKRLTRISRIGTNSEASWVCVLCAILRLNHLLPCFLSCVPCISWFITLPNSNKIQKVAAVGDLNSPPPGVPPGVLAGGRPSPEPADRDVRPARRWPANPFFRLNGFPSAGGWVNFRSSPVTLGHLGSCATRPILSFIRTRYVSTVLLVKKITNLNLPVFLPAARLNARLFSGVF
jgi:hypothetical protein